MKKEFHKDVRFLCKTCNDVHHPSERKQRYDSPMRKLCPECGGKRAVTIRDRDGYLDHCDFIAKWN